MKMGSAPQFSAQWAGGPLPCHAPTARPPCSACRAPRGCWSPAAVGGGRALAAPSRPRSEPRLSAPASLRFASLLSLPRQQQPQAPPRHCRPRSFHASAVRSCPRLHHQPLDLAVPPVAVIGKVRGPIWPHSSPVRHGGARRSLAPCGRPYSAPSFSLCSRASAPPRRRVASPPLPAPRRGRSWQFPVEQCHRSPASLAVVASARLRPRFRTAGSASP